MKEVIRLEPLARDIGGQESVINVNTRMGVGAGVLLTGNGMMHATPVLPDKEADKAGRHMSPRQTRQMGSPGRF